MTADPTGWLYPFIDADERDEAALVSVMASSAAQKLEASAALRSATLERRAGAVAAAGAAMAARFAAGGRLLAFGNGGSATDAEGAVELFRGPAQGRCLPALSLVEDQAVLTALANDIGVDAVFARQVIAHARSCDMAVGFSTSGDSRNVLGALEEAAGRGLLTVGFCGYHGGAMGASPAVEHCLLVESDSVHRIQEAQDALLLQLWRCVQRCLDEEGDHG